MPRSNRADEVAELMSRDLTTAQIAARLQLSKTSVNRIIREIRHGLGSQAV